MKWSINDIELGYLESGDGQCCLLLHGNRDNKEVFEKIVPMLETSYKIIRVDYRGHGESQVTKDGYSYEQFIEDIYEVIKKKRISPIYIIGHSLGGVLALLMAKKYPALVKGLVLMATSSHFEPKFQRPIKGEKISREMIKETNRKAVPFFFNYHYHDVQEQILNNWNQIPAFVHEKMIEMGHVDLRNQLYDLNVPVLVMSGSEDKICLSGKNSILEELNHAEYVEILETDHYFFMEKPDETAEQILQFINSLNNIKE